MGGQEPNRNRVVAPARQATQPDGIGSLESIIGLLKSLKIRDKELGALTKELASRILFRVPAGFSSNCPSLIMRCHSAKHNNMVSAVGHFLELFF
jgi:hypothetical protein